MYSFFYRANKKRWNFLPPPPHNLTAFKGAVHIAANRDFVDFALHNKKAKDLLQWVKKVKVPDECFFATLNHNPILRIKGSYLGKIHMLKDFDLFLLKASVLGEVLLYRHEGFHINDPS